MADTINYLNCGCGSRFHPSWENLDFVSNSAHVKQYDLSKGLPYPDKHFKVVYHSHVLEHFSKTAAVNFILECNRVLEPGGIIRIAVPDLEALAKCYLENLQKAASDPTVMNDANYKWSVIELFDQMVRNSSGGEMARYWNGEIVNEDYIVSRLGHEFIEYRQRLKEPVAKQQPVTSTSGILTRVMNKVRSRFLKPVQPYVDLGKFRMSGEVHQWMYDRYSLACLLRETNFENIQVTDAFTSRIPNWQEYSFLDVEGGKPRKPDSIFIEAVKK